MLRKLKSWKQFLYVAIANVLQNIEDSLEVFSPASAFVASGCFLSLFFYNTPVFALSSTSFLTGTLVLFYRAALGYYNSYFCNALLENSQHAETVYLGAYIGISLITIATLFIHKTTFNGFLACGVLITGYFTLAHLKKKSMFPWSKLDTFLLIKILFTELYFLFAITNVGVLSKVLTQCLLFDEVVCFIALGHRLYTSPITHNIELKGVVAELILKVISYVMDAEQLANISLYLTDLYTSCAIRLWFTTNSLELENHHG